MRLCWALVPGAGIGLKCACHSRAQRAAKRFALGLRSYDSLSVPPILHVPSANRSSLKTKLTFFPI